MTARQWAALAVLLLAGGVAALDGTVVPLCVIARLALAAYAVAAPAQSGTYRRRTPIAVPGAVHAPSTGAEDGPHLEGVMS